MKAAVDCTTHFM